MITMNTDKKIKDFFHSERPPVNDGEAFLREFERLSALLPQPASLTEYEDLEKAERLQKLYCLVSGIRKTGRTEAAVTGFRYGGLPSALYIGPVRNVHRLSRHLNIHIRY